MPIESFDWKINRTCDSSSSFMVQRSKACIIYTSSVKIASESIIHVVDGNNSKKFGK